MTLPEFFILFNIVEGLFWITLAIAAYSCRYKLPRIWKYYWEQLSLVLVIFGISDWIEVYSPIGFLEPGGEWLLAIKAFCVIWMSIAGVQYFRRRI